MDSPGRALPPESGRPAGSEQALLCNRRRRHDWRGSAGAAELPVAQGRGHGLLALCELARAPRGPRSHPIVIGVKRGVRTEIERAQREREYDRRVTALPSENCTHNICGERERCDSTIPRGCGRDRAAPVRASSMRSRYCHPHGPCGHAHRGRGSSRFLAARFARLRAAPCGALLERPPGTGFLPRTLVTLLSPPVGGLERGVSRIARRGRRTGGALGR
jgi:hypothetical protein